MKNLLVALLISCVIFIVGCKFNDVATPEEVAAVEALEVEKTALESKLHNMENEAAALMEKLKNAIAKNQVAEQQEIFRLLEAKKAACGPP